MNLILIKLLGVVKNTVCKILKYKRWGIPIYMYKKTTYGKAKTIQDSYRLRTLSVLCLPRSLIIWAAPLQWAQEGQERSESAIWLHVGLLLCKLVLPGHQQTAFSRTRGRKIGPLILCIDPGAQTIPPCVMTMTRNLYPASFVLQKIRLYEIMTRYCLSDSLIKKRSSRFFLFPCIIYNWEDTGDI